MQAHTVPPRNWFPERRFGLFIHWGLYAIPAWHEQMQWRMPVPKDEYARLAGQFNPAGFNPDEWLDLAETAGMRYLCITTKHHDGFCLWNTRETDFNIMNTPYNRDVLALLAEACHRRDFGLCLYYSNPDWHHPNAPKGGNHELPEPNPGDQPDEDRYYAFVKRQARELCSNYGRILSFWWDIPPSRREEGINAMIRELQPGILINDRGHGQGDFDTPEREVPPGKRFDRPTEACQSVGRQSWGYRDNEDFYSVKSLCQSMAKIMAMGGNYLLNVGPRADGRIPEEAAKILRAMGRWYGKTEKALRAEPASHLLDRDAFMLTRSGNILHVLFHKDPEATGLLLDPIAVLPRRARVLNNHRDLTAKVELMPTKCYPGESRRPCLHLNGMPVDRLAGEVIVLELEFENLDDALKTPTGVLGEYRL